MRRSVRLAVAELAALRGRHLWSTALVAAAGSMVGGLAMAALVLPFDGASAVEASTVVVSRGSSAPVALVLLASLAVAGPYRDGSWMHGALAAPRPAQRLAATALPIVALGVGIGAIAAASTAIGAAVVHPQALAALPPAALAHLLLVAIWTSWMLCVAHASRSPLVTFGVGAGLPLVVEPALAGALAQSPLADARWLLPMTALRSLAELPVGRGEVLGGPPQQQGPLLVAAVLGWTAVAALAAWARARAAQPR